MKTILLTIATLLVANFMGAQTFFTVHDYDDCKTLTTGGNPDSVETTIPVANPDAADTNNPNVTQFSPNVKNASVFLNLPYTISVTSSTSTDDIDWQFRYYTDNGGTIDSGSGRTFVRLFNKSVGASAGNFVQLKLIDKVGGSWQTESGTASLTGASQAVIDAGGYDAVLFVINNANGATTPANDALLIDDLAFSTNLNLSDEIAGLETGNSWILNFSPDEINKTYEQSDLVAEEASATPSLEGNDSATVMKITRGDATNPYLNFAIDPIDKTAGGTIKYRIYPECKLGVVMNTRLMLRKDNLGPTQQASQALSLIPNVWNEVEIDIDALLGAEITADNLYNNILVFFNSGDASAEAVDTIFYLDAFQAPSTAVLSTENTTLETGLHLLGNPVNQSFILSKEANSIKIYTITGKTILSYNSKNTTYNVSSLSHGIYYAEATFDTGKKVFKFIKN
jgi:hypothetical protein